MASSSTSAEPQGLQNVSLIGGIPTRNQDLVASIAFVAAYALLEVLVIYRFISPSSRTTALIRPLIFVQVRIAAWVVRIIQSTGNYATGYFIAEQILLLIGVLFIIETLVAILGAQFNRVDPATSTDPEYSWRTTGASVQPAETKGRKLPVLSLMRVALLVAYSNLDEDGVKDHVKAAKIVSSSLGVAVVGLAIIVGTYLQTKSVSPPLNSYIFHMVCAILLMITSAYKLHNSLTLLDPLSSSTKVQFYVLSALPEFLAALLYFGANLKQMYAMGKPDEMAFSPDDAERGNYRGVVGGEAGGVGRRPMQHEDRSYLMTQFDYSKAESVGGSAERL